MVDRNARYENSRTGFWQETPLGPTVYLLGIFLFPG